MAKRFALQVRLSLAVSAVVLPPLAIIAFGAGAYMFERRLLSLEATRLWLTVSAAIGAAGLAALASGRVAGWISWRWLALLVLPALVPIGAAVYATDWERRHPSVSEISTDLIEPPAISNVVTPMWPGAAEAQKRNAPQIKSLTVKPPPPAVVNQATALAKVMGWTVSSASPQDGLAEGRLTFGRYGYSRTWVLRVRPELGGGSLVDVRLRSKPGEPDFGQNAGIVKSFLERLAAEAD